VSATAGTSIRWGVAATGRIAAQFVDGLAQVDDAEVVAVGSRAQSSADAFGDRWGIARRHGSLDALAADPDVDVVYVASPHAAHHDDALRFLRAGKHVLCEKPLALDAAQSGRMVAEARDRGLFLMEAIWSRFLPAYAVLRELLADGRIGEPQVVEADFGFALPFDPAHRLYDPALGGGSTLDLGIYPVQLCSMVFGGPPDTIAANGHLGPTGVDERMAAVLGWDGGRLGVVKSAITVGLACEARISGTDGWIDLPAFMHCPQHLTVVSGGVTERVDAGYDGEGLRFQVPEVHRCIRAGLVESPVLPHDESLAIARTLDAIRAQLGLRYPGEGSDLTP
jgi:predicted dehydrogenase